MDTAEQIAMSFYGALRREGVRLTHWSPMWADASPKQRRRFVSLIASLVPPTPDTRARRIEAAARAVVEGRRGPYVARAQGRPCYEVDAEALAALRAAVEGAEEKQ